MLFFHNYYTVDNVVNLIINFIYNLYIVSHIYSDLYFLKKFSPHQDISKYYHYH